MNTMPNTQETNSCNVMDISNRNTDVKKEKTRGFTSDGRPVPKAADSIKTIKEVNKIRNYFLDKKEYRNYMLWMLGICTAYRCGDILSFKFNDIFEEDKTTFKRNISLYEEKTGKYREMEITEPMKIAINKYIESIDNIKLVIATLLGFFSSLIFGPFKNKILLYIGDRRSDYNDDVLSSSFLYLSFWILVLFVFYFQCIIYNFKSKFNDPNVLFAISMLSLILLNLFIGGYSTRILAFSMPFMLILIYNFAGIYKILTVFLYLIYVFVYFYMWW